MRNAATNENEFHTRDAIVNESKARSAICTSFRQPLLYRYFKTAEIVSCWKGVVTLISRHANNRSETRFSRGSIRAKHSNSANSLSSTVVLLHGLISEIPPLCVYSGTVFPNYYYNRGMLFTLKKIFHIE